MGVESLSRDITNLADVKVVPKTTNTLELNMPVKFDSTLEVVGNVTADANVAVTGTLAATGAFTPTGGIVKGSRTKQLGGKIRQGATGTVAFTASDTGSKANVAASQSAATLIVFIEGLEVGDVITGFGIYSSINSAGNTVTIDGNLRTLTVAAAATGTDASVSSMTQVSVTAATASSATKTGLSTTIVAGVSYYILVTVTTGASTSVQFNQFEVTYTPNAAQ